MFQGSDKATNPPSKKPTHSKAQTKYWYSSNHSTGQGIPCRLCYPNTVIAFSHIKDQTLFSQNWSVLGNLKSEKTNTTNKRGATRKGFVT
jgi:hypothetical protein